MMEELIAQLSERMARPLPGLPAQLRMASGIRIEETKNYRPNTSNAKMGAVLIALYPDNGVLRTVLMKRPDYVGAHSGQVSFPGGKVEKSDADVVAAALREAQEEVNITPSAVHIIGQLTQLYIPPSNFLVHPVLGVLSSAPQLIPDRHEVQSIHIPELRYLLRDDIIHEKDITLSSGFRLRTPYFEVDGHTVWGATAMIIAELKEFLRGLPI